MAHCAELDQDGTVLRVIVVDNKHADPEAWCRGFFGGGIWKQTSYNATIRGNYAGIGFKYEAGRDAFVAPKPFASAVLDEKHQWQPPTKSPGPGYVWKEPEGWVLGDALIEQPAK